MFAPKDKIGDWLEIYTRVMELNYWIERPCKSARYDEAPGEWTVEVERDGETLTLRPKQLVLATGMSGKPNMPDFPGRTCSAATAPLVRSIPGPTRTPASEWW